MAYVRSVNASANENINLTFNNDSSALYNVQRLQVANGAVAGGQQTLSTSANAGDAPAANATAKTFGIWTLLMPAYDNTSNFKACVCSAGGPASPAGDGIGDRTAVSYESTAAITRLKIVPASASNWKAGSRLIVYALQ